MSPHGSERKKRRVALCRAPEVVHAAAASSEGRATNQLQSKSKGKCKSQRGGPCGRVVAPSLDTIDEPADGLAEVEGEQEDRSLCADGADDGLAEGSDDSASGADAKVQQHGERLPEEREGGVTVCHGRTVDSYKRDSSGVSVELTLACGESLALRGYAFVTLRKGKVDLFGRILERDKPEFVAALQEFGCLPVVTNYSRSQPALIHVHSERRMSIYRELLAEQLGCHEADVEDKQLRTSIVDLGTMSDDDVATGSGFSLCSTGGGREAMAFYGFDRVLEIPLQWRDAALRLRSLALGKGASGQDSTSTSTTPIAVVCGPRDSGKSTLCRYLCNTLVSCESGCVAYLEADPGQSALVPPGVQSVVVLKKGIYGEPYVWKKGELAQRDGRSYFLGDVSAKGNPNLYLRHIQELVRYYRRTLHPQGIPLVVNTMGWVKGLGLELLTQLLRETMPTHAIVLRTEMENKNVPEGRFWLWDGEEDSSILWECEAVSPKPGRKGTAQQRVVQWCKHLVPVSLFQKNMEERAATLLASSSPYRINHKTLRIHCLQEGGPADTMLEALNLTFVGLASSSLAHTEVIPCVGVGFVRGVDERTGELWIYSRLNEDDMEQVDTLLVAGFLPVPAGFLAPADDYLCSPYLSNVAVSAQGTGSVMRSRNNLVRSSGAGNS